LYFLFGHVASTSSSSNTVSKAASNATLSLTIQVDLKGNTPQRYRASLPLNALGQCTHFLLKLNVWIISDNAQHSSLIACQCARGLYTVSRQQAQSKTML
jgi:hypothetical protein